MNDLLSLSFFFFFFYRFWSSSAQIIWNMPTHNYIYIYIYIVVIKSYNKRACLEFVLNHMNYHHYALRSILFIIFSKGRRFCSFIHGYYRYLSFLSVVAL